MLSYLRKVMRQNRENGASAVEYALMVAAIAAVIVGVVFALGGVVSGLFNKTCNGINTGTADATKTCVAPKAPEPPVGG